MTNQLIVCLTNDDNGNREDCNVFYSEYYLIISDTLTFSEESLFSEEKILQYSSRSRWLAAVRKLGYTIPKISQRVIVLKGN
jgi:hypothetical protein